MKDYEPPAHLEVSEEWNGFKRGDIVKSTRDPKGSYEFVNFTRNTKNDSVYVTCVGGTKGHSRTRAFPPDTITSPGASRTSSAESVDGSAGAEIRHAREAQNLSRGELAKMSGLTVSRIAGIEAGRKADPGLVDALRAALKL